jgi:aspartate carbamoyltransferase catalytic subunit
MVAIALHNPVVRAHTETQLKGSHILSIRDLNRAQITWVLEQARRYEAALKAGERIKLLDGAILATLFYEPSTRTRLSFEAAMHRLGGAVISTPDMGTTSSTVKGESLADSIRTVCGYADIIALRHPAIGSAREAAHYSSRPIVNAGDGAGEHPTQALLDLYTILAERGQNTLSGLKIVLAGDLKNGRTVHSLANALALWEDVEIVLAAPDSLRMPESLVADLLDMGACVSETSDLHNAVHGADVLYMTRIQKERFVSTADYDAVKNSFIVDDLFMACHPDLTLMHPLPRVNEITPEVDRSANAAYFRQANNGLYVRMALLALVLGQSI